MAGHPHSSIGGTARNKVLNTCIAEIEAHQMGKKSLYVQYEGRTCVNYMSYAPRA